MNKDYLSISIDQDEISFYRSEDSNNRLIASYPIYVADDNVLIPVQCLYLIEELTKSYGLELDGIQTTLKGTA